MRVETLATRPDLLDAALALGDIGRPAPHGPEGYGDRRCRELARVRVAIRSYRMSPARGRGGSSR